MRLRQTLSEAARFFSLGHPPPWTFVAIPFAVISGAALGVVPPLLVGNIVDALQRRNEPQTLHLLLIYGIVTLLAGLLGLIGGYSSSVFRETLARNTQLNLLAKISRASFNALSELTLGQITNRILGDVRALGSQLEYSLFPTLSNVCALIATVVAMIHVDYRLAILAFLCSFAVLLPLSVARPHIAALQVRASSANDDLYGAVTESTSVAGLIMYRNASASRVRARQLAELTATILKLRVKAVVIGALAGVGSSLSNMIGPWAVVGLGAYFVVRGQLSVGGMIAILIYQSRLSAPIGALSQLQITFATMGVTIGRLLNISNLPDEESGDLEFFAGDVTLNDVTVTRGGTTILRDVNARIERGRHVAIIGPSGAGKSSLASLLVRLYDPDRGTVRIGDRLLQDISLESLRSSVCMISQESYILDASVRENITLNQAALDSSTVEGAISIARLENVLQDLPDGWETRLGQRGFRLSGGQRQRICLARGLIQDPKILILDEALTGVDMDMERQILNDLRIAFSERTMIVVTHRLESVRGFDAFLAIVSGSIVAEGVPRDLFQDERWSRMAAAWAEPALRQSK